jgi:hypothetical protein
VLAGTNPVRIWIQAVHACPACLPDRNNPGERDRYAAAKRQAAAEANAAGEHLMQYNARKQQAIREIYHRASAAAGLLEP